MNGKAIDYIDLFAFSANKKVTAVWGRFPMKGIINFIYMYCKGKY